MDSHKHSNDLDANHDSPYHQRHYHLSCSFVHRSSAAADNEANQKSLAAHGRLLSHGIMGMFFQCEAKAQLNHN